MKLGVLVTGESMDKQTRLKKSRPSHPNTDIIHLDWEDEKIGCFDLIYWVATR